MDSEISTKKLVQIVIILSVIVSAVIIGIQWFFGQLAVREINKEITKVMGEAKNDFGREVKNSADLSACGDFPSSSGDGGPTSRYFVCRDGGGACSYEKAYPKQIDGCNPEFDKNPYGRPECFVEVVDIYNLNGELIRAGFYPAASSMSKNCAATTQEFFDSKVSK